MKNQALCHNACETSEHSCELRLFARDGLTKRRFPTKGWKTERQRGKTNNSRIVRIRERARDTHEKLARREKLMNFPPTYTKTILPSVILLIKTYAAILFEIIFPMKKCIYLNIIFILYNINMETSNTFVFPIVSIKSNITKRLKFDINLCLFICAKTYL